MPNEDDLDIFDDVENDIGPVDESTIEEVRVEDLTPQELCDVVVAFRYLGLFRERATKCMEELAQRRMHGDDFEFEKQIDETVKSLPVIEQKISVFR